jgi:hypothetical protein
VNFRENSPNSREFQYRIGFYRCAQILIDQFSSLAALVVIVSNVFLIVAVVQTDTCSFESVMNLSMSAFGKTDLSRSFYIQMDINKPDMITSLCARAFITGVFDSCIYAFIAVSFHII